MPAMPYFVTSCRQPPLKRTYSRFRGGRLQGGWHGVVLPQTMRPCWSENWTLPSSQCGDLLPAKLHEAKLGVHRLHRGGGGIVRHIVRYIVRGGGGGIVRHYIGQIVRHFLWLSLNSTRNSATLVSVETMWAATATHRQRSYFDRSFEAQIKARLVSL
jgi:hypothetical protein